MISPSSPPGSGTTGVAVRSDLGPVGGFLPGKKPGVRAREGGGWLVELVSTFKSTFCSRERSLNSELGSRRGEAGESVTETIPRPTGEPARTDVWASPEPEPGVWGDGEASLDECGLPSSSGATGSIRGESGACELTRIPFGVVLWPSRFTDSGLIGGEWCSEKDKVFCRCVGVRSRDSGWAAGCARGQST